MQCLIVYLLSLFVFDLGLSSVGISEIWITEYGPDSGQSGVFFACYLSLLWSYQICLISDYACILGLTLSKCYTVQYFLLVKDSIETIAGFYISPITTMFVKS